MVSQLTGFLDSYDLLGKTIPGIAWFFGLTLLLPTGVLFPDTTIPGEGVATYSFGQIAGLLAIATIVGLIFGQGIDILARLTEQSVAWVRRQIGIIAEIIISSKDLMVNRLLLSINAPTFEGVQQRVILAALLSTTLSAVICGFLQGLLLLDISLLIDDYIGLFSFISFAAVLTLIFLYFGVEQQIIENLYTELDEEVPSFVPRAIPNQARQKVISLIRTLNTALTSHRELFESYLHTTGSYYLTPRDPDRIGYNNLEAVAEPYYDVEFDDFGPESNSSSFSDLYPYFRTKLDAEGVSRAAGFQARYSFCRSMWLTTFTFFLLFGGVYVYFLDIDDTSVITGNIIDAIPLQAISIIFSIVLTIVIVAILIDWSFKMIFGHTPLILTWSAASGIGLLTIESILGGWLIESTVGLLVLFIEHIVIFGYNLFTRAGEFCAVIFSYSSGTNPFVIELFGDALLGVTIFIGLAAIAFFSATSSYKSSYIEYLITDMWECLREYNEPEFDRSSGEDDETITTSRRIRQENRRSGPDT